jgi:predicted ATPase
MSTINIKNIGPISEVQIDLKKINIIIGPQSSGKSVLAKIVSFCQWAEKRFILDGNKFEYSFRDMFIEFHRIDYAYFSTKSSFVYDGDYVVISQSGKKFELDFKPKDTQKEFKKPKNIYIPAERNFASVIPNLGRYNETNDNIMNFLYDWFEAKRNFQEENKLDILNLGVSYHYSQDSESDILTLKNKKQINLRNSSSGLQSVIPLVTLINYLTDGFYKKNRSNSVNEREALMEELMEKIESERLEGFIDKTSENDKRFNKISVREFLSFLTGRIQYSFTNFVIEEPEQNLFPSTQRDFIYYLFKKLTDKDRNHKALITTHSPFILYAINNCLMGERVSPEMPDDEEEELKSFGSWIDSDFVSVWQMEDGKAKSIIDDRTGTVTKHYFNDVMKEIQDEYYEMLSYFKYD